MGDGIVLEQGTHNELLRNEQGPYSRLVAAQILREKRDIELSDSHHDTMGGQTEDMDKKLWDEVPLGRKKSGHSLASNIIEQRQKLGSDETQKSDHNLPYLFMRLGKLNRVGWKNYGIGAVAACST